MGLQRTAVVVLMFFCFSSAAQDLIRNGSFEKRKRGRCPTGFSQLAFVKSWFSLNRSSPDLFCTCAKKDNSLTGAPLNHNGSQLPHTGKCYLGIICREEMNEKDIFYKEYISTALTQQLQKDKLYCLSFYYSLADLSKFKMTSLGALFLPGPVYEVGQGKKIPDYSFRNTIENDTVKWRQFCEVYKSYGDEKILVIGSFDDDFEVNTGKDLKKTMAYYFIDDVALRMVADSSACQCGNKRLRKPLPEEVPQESTGSENDPSSKDGPEKYEKAHDKIIILQNINFSLNSSELKESSFAELNDLADYLSANPGYRLQLYGHTDNTGTESENMTLSAERARSVKDFLVKKGVRPVRITSEGFGSTRPLATNTSEENKLKNRRVEFRIVTR